MVDTWPTIQAVVEGITDEAALRKIATLVGIEVDKVYGRNGKDEIRKGIKAYNSAANFGLWVVLVDLDHENECAPALVSSWLPTLSPGMHLRIAVREIEAWLMADAEALAAFLRITQAAVPVNPDILESPKRDLLNVVRRSQKPKLKEAMLPRPGSGRDVGPLYTSEVQTFFETKWDPQRARMRSNSLDRFIRCLEQIKAGSKTGPS